MTRKEAQEAWMRGEKVKKVSWYSDEYVYRDEDGVMVGWIKKFFVVDVDSIISKWKEIQ